MARFRVVVADFITDELRPEREVLGDIADLITLNANSESDLVGKIEDADSVMLYHNIIISKETIARLKHCKLIVRCGVGFDNVDYRFARERGIPVGNVPDYGTEEVADSAIGLMLAMTPRHQLLQQSSSAQGRAVELHARHAASSLAWPRLCDHRPGAHRFGGGAAREGARAWMSRFTIPTSRMATTRRSGFAVSIHSMTAGPGLHPQRPLPADARNPEYRRCTGHRPHARRAHIS